MPIFAILIAISFASLANFFIRKNIESNGTSSGYLICSFGFSFLTLGVSYKNLLLTPISYEMIGTGCMAVLLISLMLRITLATLRFGASGLTIAFQISGSIFPGLVLYFVFGESFGFAINSSLIIGLLLVIVGLFWSTSLEQTKSPSKKGLWLLLVISIFIIHLAFVSLVQARSLLFTKTPDHSLLFFRCSPEQDIWFMVGMLSIPFFLEFLTKINSARWPTKLELIYGSCGGLSNGLATYCLLFATEAANPTLKNLLFPIFSVGIIVLCNLWGQLFFKEKVNWRANFLSLSGILLASL